MYLKGLLQKTSSLSYLILWPEIMNYYYLLNKHIIWVYTVEIWISSIEIADFVCAAA